MCVVSAMGTEPGTSIKVTDLLIEIVDLAAKRNRSYVGKLQLLRDKHLRLAHELLDKK